MISSIALRRRNRPSLEALESRIVPAINKVQDIGTATGPQFQNSISIAVTQAVTAGDTVIVSVATEQGDTSAGVTVADTAGNAYNLDANVVLANNLQRTLIFSALAGNAIGMGGTITVNFAGNAQIVSAASAAEFTGVLTVDKTTTATGSSTTPSSGVTQTSFAPELLIGAIGVLATNVNQTPASTSFTPGANFSALFAASGTSGNGSRLDLKFEQQITASTGTFQANGTLGNSRSWAAALATYREVPPLQAVPVTASVVGNTTNNAINVLSGNTDPLGGTLSIKAITVAGHGTAALLPGNSGVVYSPTPGFVGTDTFTYTIQSSKGGSASATVTITVTAPPPPTNTGGGTTTTTPSDNNTNTTTTPTLTITSPRGVVQGASGLVSFRRSRIAVRHSDPAAVVRLQISASAGKLLLRGAGIKVVGANTKVLKVTGTAAAITRALPNLTLKLARAGLKAQLKLSATAGTLAARGIIAVRG